jgi:hypothetical protein
LTLTRISHKSRAEDCIYNNNHDPIFPAYAIPVYEYSIKWLFSHSILYHVKWDLIS